MAQAPRTIQEIARIANVSVKDVTSLILGQAEVESAVRIRIQTAMADLELIKIADQHTASLRKIVIVLPVQPTGDYIGKVTEGVVELVRSKGFTPDLYIQNSGYQDALTQVLRRADCEGVIPIAPHDNDHIIALCHQFQKEYVLVDYEGDDDISNTPTVEVNNFQGIQNVMRHLFHFGHSRIAFITGNMDQISAQERLRGYQEALLDAGFPCEDVMIAQGDWGHQSGYQHTRRFLQLNNPPSAIVCSNDLIAFGAIHAAREAGIHVGSQLSVTGFDDIGMAETVNPPLTTVRQPMHALGTVAAEMLIQRINGEPLPELHVMLDTELVIRQSTGPASAYR